MLGWVLPGESRNCEIVWWEGVLHLYLLMGCCRQQEYADYILEGSIQADKYMALYRYDAFTHKQTSQYSLAFEKASIIFNISAVHSCHAANQNRSEELGIKTAFHSFQASAGMFTYINENFLHAPSTDLSRETVKTLISIMLAQAQEVFLEKQIADGKKPGMLAKLAAQAGLLYSQAVEGVQENSQKGVFERVWLLVCQVWCHVPHIRLLQPYTHVPR